MLPRVHPPHRAGLRDGKLSAWMPPCSCRAQELLLFLLLLTTCGCSPHPAWVSGMLGGQLGVGQQHLVPGVGWGMLQAAPRSLLPPLQPLALGKPLGLCRSRSCDAP